MSFKRLERLHRRLTSKFRSHPSFFIIGAQKCGTTSLYEYLIQNKYIKTSSKKEIFYFDKFYGDKSHGWYLSHFPFISSKYITGEATANYIFNREVPNRVKNTIPNIKIIVLLRNPVDRAYSHYYHNHIRGRANAPFESLIENELLLYKQKDSPCNAVPIPFNESYVQSYLARGRYAEQLELWLKLFPFENFLFIESNELFSNRVNTIKSVYTFLGVESDEYAKDEVHNKGVSYPRMAEETRNRLIDYYKPHNVLLYRIINQKYDWDK